MCLIVFAWRPGHPQPLIVAANRDEFYARPASPLAAWPDAPGVYAGRDLEAGGTWLGISAAGRFAALTNIRDPGQPQGLRSRGELVAGFLAGNQAPADYLAEVADRAGAYSGFNLLAGTREELYYLNSRAAQPERLGAGVHGLSNARLDTPWPKLRKARAALHAGLDDPRPEALLALLEDRQPAPLAELPDTGVGVQTETLLSSIFIASPNYGTRASTVLIVNQDGSQRIIERSFGPQGAALEEVQVLV
ncbi:NRDE family protein [Pseudomonas sp. DTU_2021_1001937_2_SI_NGA_ILE_001]|uniref:NRDE family protein n=1 Tax=Pseudomonas sp. DTU_2021_1001937_2_SI_NGA_ILE_001 TaxID=3077589 RepID=UPI0028FC3198|nr:NRDE family protein [Pseudomonas sp. DTU_2021_1001937_2_SI_NGA_ILE_001]WNW12943.1 NRDE family protein [Pseudomonas sp. DTU_2021_1001937_2_SI_NGA_ILE_001]